MNTTNRNSSYEYLEVLGDNWEMMNENNLFPEPNEEGNQSLTPKSGDSFLDWELNEEYTTSAAEEDQPTPIFLVIEPLLMAYQLFWIVKSVRKCWGNMEPGHIFLINLLIANLLVVLGHYPTHISMRRWFSEITPLCKYLYAISTLFDCYRFASATIPEINRSLALYWNLLYKDRVTNERAFMVIGICKMTLIVHQLIYFLFFSNQFCPDIEILVLNEKSKVSLVFLLECLYCIVTICSCSYVFHVAKKIQNVVVPINIEPSQNEENQETEESHLLKMTKLGIKVNMLSGFQLGATLTIFLAQIFMPENRTELAYKITIAIVPIFNLINLIVGPVLIYKKLDLIS